MLDQRRAFPGYVHGGQFDANVAKARMTFTHGVTYTFSGVLA